MGTLGLWDEQNPLKKVTPPIGAPVQHVGGLAPSTAPVSQRPVSPPGVKLGTPGPSPGEISAPVGTTKPAVVPPVPAPAPVAPVAPVAATAPPPPAPSTVTYGPSGGGAPSLEDQLRGIITGFASGATSQNFINRAINRLGAGVEGGREQAVNRINEDAIRRGLFRSGIPAESIAATETGAQSALQSGIADILSSAEQQDIAAKESAGGMAGNLLSENRQWDMYQQQRADEQAARAAANRPEDTSFMYIDPDTGESYQMDSTWFE